MFDAVGKWLVEHHGLAGIMLAGMWIVIVALAATVVHVFRLYVKQLSLCRVCKDETEARHDRDMDQHYNIMRSENQVLWDRVEQIMARLTDAVVALSGKMAELSGKLNGMRH